ncbi:hypothetical protein EXW38_30340 (plasmid) [Bacillus mycoides]|nr:hypothetical protein EXW38_30340 [Bacillus mycoides]
MKYRSLIYLLIFCFLRLAITAIPFCYKIKSIFIMGYSRDTCKKGYRHTSINLTYIFIQNAVFPRSFLLSFIDVIKVGTSNKP